MLIESRYNGPPGSGNGGYCAGVVAAALPPGDGIPEVTLRSPPPLDRELRVQTRPDGIAVFDGDVLVAEARRVVADLDAPEAVAFADAAAASDRSPCTSTTPIPDASYAAPRAARATDCGSSPVRSTGAASPPRPGRRTTPSWMRTASCGPR